MVCRDILIVLAATGIAPGQEFDKLKQLYQYDARQPFQLTVEPADVRPGESVHKLLIKNPDGSSREGFLVLPEGRGRKPAIIWMHSGGARAWLGNAALMARAGAVSMLIGPFPTKGDRPEDFRDAMIQSVICLRKAADLLAGRDDVDPARIAIAGHSFGAMMAAVAITVDPRFRAAVFEGGLLGMSIHFGTSPAPEMASIRKELGTGLAHYLDVISVVDAKHYIGRAPAIPKLFQSAWFDAGVPRQDSEDFFRAATEPKELRWYDTGHDIDDIAVMADRARFLGKVLNMPAVDRVLRGKIRQQQLEHPSGGGMRQGSKM